MIHFQLISGSGVKFDEDVYEIIVPTKDGAIAIAQDHMPLISAGAPGILSIRKKATDQDSHLEHFAVYGGIVQIEGKSARFITDDVSTSEEVSEREAEAAHARAQEMIKKADSYTELQEARYLLQHSSARLQISKLKKRHHR